MNYKPDDPNRGNGRTTGLMLQALSRATLNPGEWIEFHDHWPGWNHGIRTERYGRMLHNFAKEIGLDYVVKFDRQHNKVLVMFPLRKISRASI